MTEQTQPARGLRAVPPGIWALGFVSLLMDVSSEMIHALLPVYLVTVMGASATVVGVIEGIAEATAAITKVFSGAISDWLGKRKVLAVIGYGLAALTKPIFPLANSVGWLVAARFIDRVGKGIRGAPRDALVADIAPPHLRGASFGLRQTLDTVGAFLGPALAIVLMWLTADNFQAVFWVAVIPAVLSVALLLFGVQEPERKALGPRVNPIRRENLRRLPGAYWWVVAIGAMFTLARFSEAFLVLRAAEGGLPLALTPLVLIAMNLVYAASAYPLGRLADSMSHAGLLAAGLLVLIAADAALAWDGHWSAVWLGVLLWGLHMGMTQGLLAAMIADTAPADLRGTAFGFFNLASGISMLFAGALAGLLWDSFGAAYTFIGGGLFGAAALVAIVLRGARADTA